MLLPFVFPPDFVLTRPVARGARCYRSFAAGSPRLRIVALQPQPESPVFMRVRENLPPFTLRLFNAFVNSKSRVSTGFSRVLGVFSGFLTILVPAEPPEAPQNPCPERVRAMAYCATIGATDETSKARRAVFFACRGCAVTAR